LTFVLDLQKFEQRHNALRKNALWFTYCSGYSPEPLLSIATNHVINRKRKNSMGVYTLLQDESRRTVVNDVQRRYMELVK